MLILQHLQAVVNIIAQNHSVEIVAATGTGKSTLVPAVFAKKTNSRVFVSVPTRTGATSLSSYIGALFPELRVGYAAEGNIAYDAESRLVYVTSGHLRRKIFSYFRNGQASNIDFCDLLFLDESHTGSVDNTVIASLWTFAAASGVAVPRIVLLSATPAPLNIVPTPIKFTIPVPTAYDIQFRYNPIARADNIKPAGIYTGIVEVVRRILSGEDEASGDILIFLPGSSEVEKMTASLTALVKKLNIPQESKPLICGAYSAMQKKDIDIIYRPAAQRKIISATNIAESSITIDGLGVVIDSMLEKRAGTSGSGGFRLTTEYVSKDSSTQRAGRTGRTRNGVVYRMIAQKKYDALPTHKVPEIQRLPIHEIVIEFVNAGLDPIHVIKDIETARVRQSLGTLTRLGMIDPEGKVTHKGNFAPKVPLGVHNAAFLYEWIQKKLPPFPGMVIASIIDAFGPNYFYIPRREEDVTLTDYNRLVQEYVTKHIGPFIGANPVLTYINMWRSFAQLASSDLNYIVSTGRMGAKMEILTKNWVRENSINNKKFRELVSILHQTTRSVVSFFPEIQVTVGDFTPENAFAAALPILTETYSEFAMRREHGSTYSSLYNNGIFKLDTRYAISQMEQNPNPPTGILALSSIQLGRTNIVSLAIPVELPQVSDPEPSVSNLPQPEEFSEEAEDYLSSLLG